MDRLTKACFHLLHKLWWLSPHFHLCSNHLSFARFLLWNYASSPLVLKFNIWEFLSFLLSIVNNIFQWLSKCCQFSFCVFVSVLSLKSYFANISFCANHVVEMKLTASKAPTVHLPGNSCSCPSSLCLPNHLRDFQEEGPDYSLVFYKHDSNKGKKNAWSLTSYNTIPDQDNLTLFRLSRFLAFSLSLAHSDPLTWLFLVTKNF